MKEKQFGVTQLSRLAGISVRTLHHYDKFGLLTPARRLENGYREYDLKQLILLQQIIIYRNLDFSLEEIKKILYDDVDLALALKTQKEHLLQRKENLSQMINNIEASMNMLKIEENIALLYKGLPTGKAEDWEKEAQEKYGVESVARSHKRIGKKSKAQINSIRKIGEEIVVEISARLDQEIDGDEIQNVVQKHFDWIENFYDVNFEIYVGLAKLYLESDAFMEFYDKYEKGSAKHLSQAMIYFAEKNLNPPHKST